MSDVSERPGKVRPSPFASLLRRFKPELPTLPLMCTVSGPRLRSLVEDDRLVPQPSNMFDELLLVLSYGRPVYQPFTGRIEPECNSFCPVVLILDGGLAEFAARIFPFVGAAWSDRSDRPEEWRGRQLEEFDLAGLKQAPSRAVSAFYGANQRYLMAAPEPHRHLAKRRFRALEPYVQWLNEIDAQDERRPATFELQFREPINLSEHMQAIVAPTHYLSDRIIADFIISFNVKAYAYSYFGGRANLYTSLIDQLTLAHVKSRGLVYHE